MTAASAAELYQQGVQQHAAGALAAAASSYRLCLQAEPNHADALNNLGALLVQQHGAAKYKEALQLVQAAIRLVPSNGRYRHSLGVVHEAAEDWAAAAAAFERAVEKRPHDAKARMHLARALKSAGQPARAVDVYKSLLQLQPDHPTAHFKLGSVLRHMGRHEAAAEAYRQQLSKDPKHVQAAFWLAALTPGPQVSCCPPEIVAKLFDGYADHFDDNLTNKLHYRTPEMLMDTILQHSAQPSSLQQAPPAHQQHTDGMFAATPPQQQQQQQQQRFAHCVDLGCGTGLMGPLLRPHTQRLVGVDLSQGMVAKAHERGCYDALAVDELVQYLEGAAAAVEQQGAQAFDLLVAADVFVYIGELQPLLQAAAAVSTGRAVFAFSTELLKAAGSEEQQQAGGYVLQPTGRYAHCPAYLRRAAAATGWSVQLLQEAQIRQNAGQPIRGNLCILQRE